MVDHFAVCILISWFGTLFDPFCSSRVTKLRIITPFLQEHGILVRVVSGFHSLGRAVKLAPDLWSAMLIRMLVKPEFQKFAFDIGSALSSHFKNQLPVSFWMGISRLLHRVVDKNEAEVS